MTVKSFWRHKDVFVHKLKTMLVTDSALKVAMAKAMTSVNNLSIKSADTGGHRAPVCIVCNSICDTLTLAWIERKTISHKRLLLIGPILPTSVREFYTYKGNGQLKFMDGLLLSPHASWKAVKRSTDNDRDAVDCFSCCKMCLDHLSKAW